MTGRARWNHSPAFKAKVALAAVKGDRTLARWRSNSTFTPIRSHRGKRSLKAGPLTCLAPGGGRAAELPAIDVKLLHAKIGELTLENEFLEGPLTKGRHC